MFLYQYDIRLGMSRFELDLQVLDKKKKLCKSVIRMLMANEGPINYLMMIQTY